MTGHAMTGPIGAAAQLEAGLGLLRKYGLYDTPAKVDRGPLEQALRELELETSPEIETAWQALHEAKRLIGYRNAIAGTRVLLSDYFAGLAIQLVLPLRSGRIMDAGCEQLRKIGQKVNSRHPRRGSGAVCAMENPLMMAAGNKLIQAMVSSGQHEAAQQTMRALCHMEELFRDRFARPESGEPDAAVYGALTGGGKRLRPILLFLCSGFGRPVGESELAGLMAAVELVHCASLVHDDIVDRSPLRHGKPTINQTRGDAYAARCGFWMMSHLLELLRDTPEDAIIRLFAEIPMEMCRGELRQIDVEYRPELQTEQDYYWRMERKTAKLIQGACMAGGLAARAEAPVLDALADFGHSLGLLFQLRDDLLDYRQWQDEGKPVLQDIERGVYTLPLIYALEQADEATPEGKHLRRLLRQPVKNPSDRRYLLELAERTGGVAYAANAIEREAVRAYVALEELPHGWQRDALACLLGALSGDVLKHCTTNVRVEMGSSCG